MHSPVVPWRSLPCVLIRTEAAVPSEKAVRPCRHLSADDWMEAGSYESRKGAPVTAVMLVNRGAVLELGLEAGHPDGAHPRVMATGSGMRTTTVFERVELPHDRIALRTLDGHYLSCQPDLGANYGLYLADSLGPREAFEEVLWPDGTVSLRSCDLTFVTAEHDRDQRVVVNRLTPDDDARFTYREVPAVVPTQGRRTIPSDRLTH